MLTRRSIERARRQMAAYGEHGPHRFGIGHTDSHPVPIPRDAHAPPQPVDLSPPKKRPKKKEEAP